MAWILFVQIVKTLSLILFYYCFSISITFYNKWILAVSELCIYSKWSTPCIISSSVTLGPVKVSRLEGWVDLDLYYIRDNFNSHDFFLLGWVRRKDLHSVTPPCLLHETLCVMSCYPSISMVMSMLLQAHPFLCPSPWGCHYFSSVYHHGDVIVMLQG